MISTFDDILFRIEDLKNNPTPRVPVCICIDTSGSMGAVTGDCVKTGRTAFVDGREWKLVSGGTTRLEELTKGIEHLYASIRKDDIATSSVEVCIVTFGDEAKCVMDFANINRQNKLPKLKAEGETSLGEGVNLALDLLARRKEEYKDKGVDYYQPWLIIMTDGQQNGQQTEFERAVGRTCQLVKDKKITIFPIAIGNEADMVALNRLSPRRSAVRLKGLKFKEFFNWISQSLSIVSQSLPGENIKLDLTNIRDWSEL